MGFSRDDEKELTPDYYYEQISPDIAKTFSHEQKQEVKAILKRAIRIPSKKLVEARFTFWFIIKLYCVVFIGRDRRTSKRGLDEDTYKNRMVVGSLKGLFYLLEVAVVIAIIFMFLYMFKTSMGIDIFPDSHLGDMVD